MTISIGAKIPSGKLRHMTSDGPKDITTDEVFAGKTVVIFGLPGAFTPTCSAKHLPGFIEKAAEFKAKGVDTIACVSVNDAFVMGAWGKDQKVGDAVLLLADGNGDFVKSLGLDADFTNFGMGLRSKRFALVAKDGVATVVNVEQPGAFEVSSAEAVLKVL
jgi:glutaredoxin/glutathione-dependent peroxiredoxin